jgi:hypothetical protein
MPRKVDLFNLTRTNTKIIPKNSSIMSQTGYCRESLGELGSFLLLLFSHWVLYNKHDLPTFVPTTWEFILLPVTWQLKHYFTGTQLPSSSHRVYLVVLSKRDRKIKAKTVIICVCFIITWQDGRSVTKD